MEREISLLNAVPYLRAYHGQTFVIKLGGSLIQNQKSLAHVARDIAVLHRLGISVIVVHGGGPQLDSLTENLGFHVDRVGGRRITSPEVLDAAKMLFRGQINLDLVSALTREGEKAVGLSGADGHVIVAKRRPEVEITDDSGEKRMVDFGEVGDIEKCNPSVLEAILGEGAIPVLNPLASDLKGNIYNCNADGIAAEVAVAMRAAKLLLVTDAPGIMRDVGDPHSMLHYTDAQELKQFESEGAFKQGMNPKVTSIFRALDGGVLRVHVVNSKRVGALLEEIFTNDGCGTLVVRDKSNAPRALSLGAKDTTSFKFARFESV